jgi:two-component system, NtrC family, C4-dicarboxylate transport sensor histidine kinase DctB
MSVIPDTNSATCPETATAVAFRWTRFFGDSRTQIFAAILALLAIGAWTSERWAYSSARAAGDAQARQLALSNAALFNSELQKFRLLPSVLIEYPDVAQILRAPAGDAEALNRRLEVLAERTGASAIYVIAPDGHTLASSNYRLSTSFVGQNYGFRPYFSDALANGSSELFALGTVSGRPGLFIARRVGPTGTPLGVIVVKIEFDRIERAWRAQQGLTFVSDAHGVVIVSSRTGWRFHRLRDLDLDEQAEIARTRQFNDLPLAPLPVAYDGGDVRFDNAANRRATIPVSLEGAYLTTLAPIGPELVSARARVRLVLLGIAIIIAGIAIWLVRQRERQALQLVAQRELEAKVLERTAELRDVNARLLREGAMRQRSEERYRLSREELAQANRLSTLGQVAAGVAHEINQPVAAIRTFSENAVALIRRGMADKAGENLTQVIGLTERIAQITGELRTFARRKTPAIGPVRVDEAIEAALLLVHHRVVASATEIVWDAKTANRVVAADRVRLEQVFVNLIQNALEATAFRSGARIEVEIGEAGERLFVRFTDNGNGMPAEIRRKLFTPFVTGREDGLGLGLAIARDILREFGGDLEIVSTGTKGTAFLATLVPA